MKHPGDLYDWDSDEMKKLGPEGRGRLIMDFAGPRAYSWQKVEGRDYLRDEGPERPHHSEPLAGSIPEADESGADE